MKCSQRFNISCIVVIIVLAAVSVLSFTFTHKSTQAFRNFSIEEIDAQYEWDEAHENKYVAYSITNNSDTDYNNCKLRVSLEDRYTSFMDYSYSDEFSIKAGETKTISTKSFGEIEKSTELSDEIYYVNNPKVIINEE